MEWMKEIIRMNRLHIKIFSSNNEQKVTNNEQKVTNNQQNISNNGETLKKKSELVFRKVMQLLITYKADMKLELIILFYLNWNCLPNVDSLAQETRVKISDKIGQIFI